MAYYEMYSVYDEQQSDLLATFEVTGSDEKIVRYFPPDGVEPNMAFQTAANEAWTTQQLLMYFTRGDLKQVPNAPERNQS